MTRGRGRDVRYDTTSQPCNHPDLNSICGPLIAWTNVDPLRDGGAYSPDHNRCDRSLVYLNDASSEHLTSAMQRRSKSAAQTAAFPFERREGQCVAAFCLPRRHNRHNWHRSLSSVLSPRG